MGSKAKNEVWVRVIFCHEKGHPRCINTCQGEEGHVRKGCPMIQINTVDPSMKG